MSFSNRTIYLESFGADTGGVTAATPACPVVPPSMFTTQRGQVLHSNIPFHFHRSAYSRVMNPEIIGDCLHRVVAC